MPIQVGYMPSVGIYGRALAEASANQERWSRLMDATQQMTQMREVSSRAATQEGQLALSREQFEKELPLKQKASDLSEVEQWLAKSVAYFKARSEAAQKRLTYIGLALESSEVFTPGQSSLSQSFSVPGMSISRAQSGPAPSEYRRTTRISPASADAMYAEELAKIDEVFGVTKGWTPNLFMGGNVSSGNPFQA